jgi:hypothetical protein
MKIGRHDTQHNDIEHNEIQHSETVKNIENTTLSITTLGIRTKYDSRHCNVPNSAHHAECRYADSLYTGCCGAENI